MIRPNPMKPRCAEGTRWRSGGKWKARGATLFTVGVIAACVDSTPTGPEPKLVPLGLRAAVTVVSNNNNYTLNADFDQGTLLNVNHSIPNQLQLNTIAQPFPFVNIAASARGTAIRIDVNTGQILGEYFTAPNGMGRDPSRTTVDQLGNVWVSNRAEAGGGKGSIARIGLVTGGTRSNADGAPNPIGQYLMGPLGYNTCLDRNGDGLIRTSRTLGDIRPWTNAGGADANGGVTTAEDECIINYTRVAGTGTRTIAVDANNDIWTGGSDSDHEKVNGITGQPIPGTLFNVGCGGYGGMIDKAGVLWSARFGTGLLRFNPAAPPGVCLGNSHGDYGLASDPVTGEIWHTDLSFGFVAKHGSDLAYTHIAHYGHGNANAQGVAVDASGNVWVAHSLFGTTTVGHLRTNGTFVGNVNLPGGNGPTGVAVDANGKVWVANINSNNAMRIDPAGGAIGGGGFRIGAVDMTVNLGSGAGPYNYSDMTGSVAIGSTVQQGSWSIVQDGGAAGTQWGKVTWNSEPQGSVPAGGSIVVEARTSDSEAGLSGQAFAPVTNGTGFSMTGRFIEVRSTLRAAPNGTSPVLSDLRIQVVGDALPPSCVLTRTGTNALGQKFIEVTARDQESGLQSIAVTVATNLTAVVPPFTPGTTSPVVVSATKINQAAGSQLGLRVTDVAGNFVLCDPVDVTVGRDAGKPESTTIGDIPSAEHYVEIHNGNPGLTSLSISVNGKKFGAPGLKDGEARTIDVGSLMIPGNRNFIALEPRGKPGGSAWVLIRD